jgi:Holliday junction resolvase
MNAHEVLDAIERAERELANRLKELGLTARRGQQFCGANGDSDVVCEELSTYHIECKRVQALNIHDAISQAVRDGKDKTPVVIHRKNGKPWLATLFLEDWIKLAVKPTSEPS